MNMHPSTPNDPSMARLIEAIEESCVAVAEFRDAMRFVNDDTMQLSARPVVEAADQVFLQHRVRPSPTVADDVANLLASFNQLILPGKDVDLGPLPGLKVLRGARGNIREEFNQVLHAARALGWRPSEPTLPDFGSTEVPREGLAGMLKTLVARMEAVERVLDHAVAPEGERAPSRTPVQIALVNVFVKNLRVELALAKLEARVKNIVDLSALGRAIENVGELTADFVSTVRDIAAKMTATLREASDQLRPKVRKVADGFKIILSKLALSLSRRQREQAFAQPPSLEAQPEIASSDRPADFDLAKAHEMVLSGQSPPTSWSPWIDSLDFRGRPLRYASSLAGLTALKFLDLGSTQLSDLAPLADLTALQELDLNYTKVSDLAPLAGLTALRRLDLRITPVIDVAPLAGLDALQSLDLGGTRVSDITPLAGLTALQSLDLGGTQVSDLAPIAGLTALQRLDLRRTKMSDLAPLAFLTALRSLDVRRARLNNLAPLAGLKNLESVLVENQNRRAALAKTLGERGTIVTVPD